MTAMLSDSSEPGPGRSGFPIGMVGGLVVGRFIEAGIHHNPLPPGMIEGCLAITGSWLVRKAQRAFKNWEQELDRNAARKAARREREAMDAADREEAASVIESLQKLDVNASEIDDPRAPEIVAESSDRVRDYRDRLIDAKRLKRERDLLYNRYLKVAKGRRSQQEGRAKAPS